MLALLLSPGWLVVHAPDSFQFLPPTYTVTPFSFYILIHISVSHQILHLIFQIAALVDSVPMGIVKLVRPTLIPFVSRFGYMGRGYKRPRPSIFSYNSSMEIFNGVYCLYARPWSINWTTRLS